MDLERHRASFRDPSGHLFWRKGVLYRQVNAVYREHYDHLMESGLYDQLVEADMLVPHREVEVEPICPDLAYRVLRPRQIPFISYPYEWSFGALKEAALLTLDLQERALASDMILKDATGFNVQFSRGRPVFIDTLSFEKYVQGSPWPAYRQFCQHFLAPLALMSRVDVRLSGLLKSHIDGIPLDLASRLSPWSSRLSLSLLTHIHLHAASERKLASPRGTGGRLRMTRRGLKGLIQSLKGAVGALKWEPVGEWSDYYDGDSYTDAALDRKAQLVKQYLEESGPSEVWDLGSNVGFFSRLAAESGGRVISMDADPACTELHYREIRGSGRDVLPLTVDLTNPSPALGWEGGERSALLSRGEPDALLALALVHHLALGNNVPLGDLAQFFARLAPHLITEFVPKDDHQVEEMLASRSDVFRDYSQESFERDMGSFFETLDAQTLPESGRTIYFLRRRESR